MPAGDRHDNVEGFQALHQNAILNRYEGNAVLNTGTVTTGTNDIEVDVSGYDAVVNGTEYTGVSGTVPLSDGDADYPRKDIIYIDNTGSVAKKEGQPEEIAPQGTSGFNTHRPMPPDMKNIDGALLAVVYVPEGATTNSEITIRKREYPATPYFGTSQFLRQATFQDQVGIGTSSPTKVLDVRGDVNVTGAIAGATKFNNTYYVDNESELSNALSDSGNVNIILNSDIVMDNAITTTSPASIHLDLNGHTITASSNVGSAQGLFEFSMNDGYIVVEKGIIDCSSNVNTAIKYGKKSNSDYPSLAVLRDAEILNWPEWGIKAWLVAETTAASPQNRNDLIVENVYFSDGANTSGNEAIFCNNASKVSVEDVSIDAGKAAQIGAASITWRGTSVLVDNIGPSLRARNTVIEDNYFAGRSGATISVRNGVYQTSEGSTIHDDNYLTVIKDNYFDEDANINIRPWNDTVLMRKVIISNNIDWAQPITVDTTNSQATVEELVVENHEMLNADNTGFGINLTDISVNKLKVDNLELPSGFQETIWKAFLTNGSRTVNTIVENVDGLYALADISDSNNNGYGVSGEIDVSNRTPAIYSNSEAVIGNGGTEPSVVSIDNKGTETQSGDGTAKTFTISHGLPGTPNYAEVNPSSEDASTDFYVSNVTSSNIEITYDAAPPSGTDNLSWYWRAEV